MKKARIVYTEGNMTPNGRERVMRLRGGAKGSGALIVSVVFRPWSDPSEEEAARMIFAAAKHVGVEIVTPELEE